MCGEQHNHSGVWNVTTNPTCTQTGVESGTCTICGLVETRDVEALGHEYDEGVWVQKTTIVHRGEKQYTCIRCGEQYSERDNSMVWVLPVIIVVGVAILIGVFNYIRVIRKKR